MILVGDFYFFLDITLEAKGGSPGLLKNFAAKSIKIKELFDLRDIWRLRNPDVKQFTFRKNTLLVLYNKDYIIDYTRSNNSCRIFVALSANKFPVTISISESKINIHGHGFKSSFKNTLSSLTST